MFCMKTNVQPHMCCIEKVLFFMFSADSGKNYGTNNFHCLTPPASYENKWGFMLQFHFVKKKEKFNKTTFGVGVRWMAYLVSVCFCGLILLCKLAFFWLQAVWHLPAFLLHLPPNLCWLPGEITELTGIWIFWLLG